MLYNVIFYQILISFKSLKISCVPLIASICLPLQGQLIVTIKHWLFKTDLSQNLDTSKTHGYNISLFMLRISSHLTCKLLEYALYQVSKKDNFCQSSNVAPVWKKKISNMSITIDQSLPICAKSSERLFRRVLLHFFGIPFNSRESRRS